MTFPHAVRDALTGLLDQRLDINAALAGFDDFLKGHGFTARCEPTGPFVLPWHARSSAGVPPTIMVAGQSQVRVFRMPHVVAIPTRAVEDVDA